MVMMPMIVFENVLKIRPFFLSDFLCKKVSDLYLFIILTYTNAHSPLSKKPQTFSMFVYKIVSLRHCSEVGILRLKQEAQKWLIRSMDDPIVKTLVKNSNLTKTQLETLLIDVLAENISGKLLKYDEKARLRLSAVSRGAFNRTLRQARWNVIQSIYTILLLGYLGVFEDTRLDLYLEVANKLQAYMKAHRGLRKKATDEHLRIISVLHEELKTSLEQLSRPRNMSKNL